MHLTNYEKSILREIDAFKNPKQSMLGKIGATVSAPFGAVADAAFDTRAGESVGKAVEGTMKVLNNGASWTVRDKAIFKEFRKDGHRSVRTFADIQQVPLDQVDKTVGYLAAKYKTAGFAEGSTTGALGAAGIATDIPALLGLALRACNEYAVYYGFDPTIEAERAFVMHLMSAASSPSQAAKQVALAQVTRVSAMIGQRNSWKELEKLLTVKLIKKIAQALGVRLTKAKLAQVVPVVGAAVGGGYNAWYMSEVTKTASMMYRERYLIEKYGPEVIVEVR